MKQRLFGKNARRKFRSRAEQQRAGKYAVTHIHTHTHTVVRARFLKTKNTYTNKTKKERTKNSGEIKY